MSRGRVYLLLGVVLALISAVMVYTTVQGARPKPVPTRAVLVATQAIPPRTYITPENSKTLFSVASWPVSIVPAGALASPTQTLDHVIVGSVEKGAPVFLTNLSSGKTTGQTGLSIDIPAGDVAISIPITAVTAAGGAIAPGDYVDILVSAKVKSDITGTGAPAAAGAKAPAAPAPTPTAAASPAGASTAGTGSDGTQLVSLTTLQHVKVLAIGDNITPSGQTTTAKGGTTTSTTAAPTMTLLLSHNDAVLVKYAKDSGGMIDVALRRYDDTGTSATAPVDINYFLNQFGYHLVAPNQPAKQP